MKILTFFFFFQARNCLSCDGQSKFFWIEKARTRIDCATLRIAISKSKISKKRNREFSY